MHWKTSALAKRSKEMKGEEIAPHVEQVNRYAARQTYVLHDRMLSNPVSRRKLAENKPELDAEQSKVMGGLEEKGYSIVPVTEFFPDADEDRWGTLRAEGDRFVERIEAEREKRMEKAAKKAKKGKKAKGLGKGDYIMRHLGKDVPTLPADDPWLQLGISDRVLDVVNSYFGLWSKLTYVDLWYTPPAAPGVERVSSQRWHRDYNDERLVKVFIYLRDVDEDTGPLEFVPGSSIGGEYAKEWPWRPVSNDLYPPQDEFDERIPKSAQMALTGPEGSMIFCNTSGFHRGGYATGDRPRVMAVYNYSSPASLAALTLRNFEPDVPRDGLSEQAAFALSD
jgi:ectoine hydroxylase-related dioxygenase (phytanoyl-CoA dioxygenase family)